MVYRNCHLCTFFAIFRFPWGSHMWQCEGGNTKGIEVSRSTVSASASINTCVIKSNTTDRNVLVIQPYQRENSKTSEELGPRSLSGLHATINNRLGREWVRQTKNEYHPSSADTVQRRWTRHYCFAFRLRTLHHQSCSMKIHVSRGARPDCRLHI